MWDKAHVNGELQQVEGLRRRRERERELYLESEEESRWAEAVGPHGPGGGPPEGEGRLEAKRFTDVAVYVGHLYPGVDLATERKLADDEPLLSEQGYTLEVAIRRKRTGIDADIESPRAVLNPRQDKEELNIYVFAKALDSIVEIEESFTTIHWRYDADSESAFFRFNVPPLGPGTAMSQGAIEIRLYDHCLDLLDIVEISIAAVRSARLNYRALGIERRHLLWPDTAPATPRIDAHCLTRFLSIHVSPAESGFEFEFKFLRGSGEKTALPIYRNITWDDIQALIEKIREFWTELVITNYAEKISVTPTLFAEYIKRLGSFGQEAWFLLFGRRTGAERGAAESVGELLAEMQPEDGAYIQITHSRHLIDFVFPWNIIYPPSETEDINPFRFWGARYLIEQVREGPKVEMLESVPVQVAFALDRGFGDSQKQCDMFRKYVENTSGRLHVTEPIADWSTLLANLKDKPPAHLLYFYGHGYAPARTAAMRLDSARLLQERIKGLPEGSAERRAWDTFLALTVRVSDEAWMFIGDSQIRESQLVRAGDYFLGRRPVVFLNMCDSAGLMPSMTSGLVRVFLDHSATAVIGTEAPMTSVFAHQFSEAFFDNVWTGKDIGTALWQARRRFLEPTLRNPLGLAYTLYGRGTARLGAAPIIDSKPD
jgi:hypothetical protein